MMLRPPLRGAADETAHSALIVTHGPAGVAVQNGRFA